jgi:hypothetical protein
MILDLSGASSGREVVFEGGRHDGETGNTLGYYSCEDDGELFDWLDEMTAGYIETSIGPLLRYTWRADLRSV